MSNIPGHISGIILNNLVIFLDFIEEIHPNSLPLESVAAEGLCFRFSVHRLPVSVLLPWNNGCKNPGAIPPPDLYFGPLSERSLFCLTSLFPGFLRLICRFRQLRKPGCSGSAPPAFHRYPRPGNPAVFCISCIHIHSVPSSYFFRPHPPGVIWDGDARR